MLLSAITLNAFITVADYDSTYGHGYFKSGCSIGVVGHTDSVRVGFGPGVTILFAARVPALVPRLDPAANIANYLPFSGLTLPALVATGGE